MFSLLNYLRTGRLGPIFQGSHRDQVKQILGEPSDYEEPWTYPGLSLQFKGDLINCITAFAPGWEQSGPIWEDFPSSNEHLTPEMMLEWMDRNQIYYRRLSGNDFDLFAVTAADVLIGASHIRKWTLLEDGNYNLWESEGYVMSILSCQSMSQKFGTFLQKR